MQIMQILIITKVLDCSDIIENNQSLSTLCLSLGTTVFNVIMTIKDARKDAEAHEENCLEHFMINMTANNEWIPYLHLISDTD